MPEFIVANFGASTFGPADPGLLIWFEFSADPLGTSIFRPAEPGRVPEFEGRLFIPSLFGPAELGLFPVVEFKLVDLVLTVGEEPRLEATCGAVEGDTLMAVPMGDILDVGDITLPGSPFGFGEVGGPLVATTGIGRPLAVVLDVEGPLAAVLRGNVLGPGDGDLILPNSILGLGEVGVFTLGLVILWLLFAFEISNDIFLVLLALETFLLPGETNFGVGDAGFGDTGFGDGDVGVFARGKVNPGELD